jgi:hypothetical protein
MAIEEKTRTDEVKERLLAGEWLSPRLIQEEYDVSNSFLASVISRMRTDGHEFESEKREAADSRPRVWWRMIVVAPTRSARHKAAVAAATSNGKRTPEPASGGSDFEIREDPIQTANGTVISASEEAAAEAEMPLFPLPRLGSHLRITAMAIAEGRVQAALTSPEGGWMATFDVLEKDAESAAPTFGSWLQVVTMALDEGAVQIDLVASSNSTRLDSSPSKRSFVATIDSVT